MWAYNSIFYQIYPIGFCGAPVHNDGVCVPRIRKLMDWSEYLQTLGVDSILLNPIFESDNHGYDTRDFKKIDCRLGTNEDFKEVCEDLHKHNVKIVLDGVFNHVGRGFWAFKDVQEKKWDSPYKDWFHISFDGNSCYDDGFWYEGWEGHFELVKLNLQNPAVVDYLMECVKYWIDEFDIDGLRLDVAYSLDHNFMRRLRSYMNMFEIAHSLHRQFGSDQWCIYRGKHLMTFVDNHDVTRLASILTNKKHIPLAYGLLMGMPGIPCLYYGSEWAEPGEKAPDNDYALRPCFEEPKPNELTEFIKKLIRVRQGSDALCNGAYKNVVIQNHQLLFERCSEKERVIVAINAADYVYTANAGELNGTATDLVTAQKVTMNGSLELKPYSVQYLKF